MKAEENRRHDGEGWEGGDEEEGGSYITPGEKISSLSIGQIVWSESQRSIHCAAKAQISEVVSSWEVLPRPQRGNGGDMVVT